MQRYRTPNYSSSHAAVAPLDAGFRNKQKMIHVCRGDKTMIEEELRRNPREFQEFMRHTYGGGIDLRRSFLGEMFTAVILTPA